MGIAGLFCSYSFNSLSHHYMFSLGAVPTYIPTNSHDDSLFSPTLPIIIPYGRLGMVTPESPTLFRNNINRHISQMVTTRISTVKSPWLAGFNIGDEHTIAMSHGEGKFVVSEELARELFAKGQVAFQYVDANSNITMQSPENPNGSSYAIEGIISEDGLIIGKMGHTERYEENIFKNIAGNKRQPLFDNAVRYFRKK